MVNALRLLGTPLFIGFLKILGEKNIYSDDDVLEEELLKYIALIKKRIDYIAIKKFKNKLTTLKEILRDENKIRKTRILNFNKEEQIEKEVDDLEAKKDEELKELEVSLKYGTRRNIFWGLPITIHDKIELGEKTKERVDDIEILRRKKEAELENVSNIDNEAIDLLVELYIDKKR